MSLVDTVGVAAAEQLEKTVGPFIALAAYRPLLTRASTPELRARAILGALRCAVRLRDAREVIALSEAWSGLGRSDEHFGSVLELCKGLFAERLAAAAVALSRAETERRPAARAFYLFARCLELAGDGSAAMQAYGRAVEQADADPAARRIALAARTYRIERLSADPRTTPRAAAEALLADPETATDVQKLVIAAARLRAPSRFVRASGLSLLEELGRGEHHTAEAAIRLAAEHADAFGDALTPLEADRLVAVLRHWRDPTGRDRALSRLKALVKIAALDESERDGAIIDAAATEPDVVPFVCRARAVLAGGGQGSYGPASDAAASHPALPAPMLLANLGLDAVVALQRGRSGEAARALAEAREQVRAIAAIPPPIWTAATLAAASLDEAVKHSASLLLEALLDQARAPPPRGYASIACALEAAGRPDVAVRAWRAAAAMKEPHASERLGRALLQQGWALSARGERDAAVEALEEARRHLLRQDPA